MDPIQNLNFYVSDLISYLAIKEKCQYHHIRKLYYNINYKRDCLISFNRIKIKSIINLT